MRLQKYLATAGIASRRKAEEYILQGKVIVNDEVVTTLGTKVEPGDVVKYNGEVITLEEQVVYYVLYKPIGYVTTVSDEKNRPTILDLMKDVEERIFPIGRLDYLTSGLLLLTNDGELTYKITHPKHQVKKTYSAKVEGMLTREEIRALEEGVVIDDRKTAPAEVRVEEVARNKTTLLITIHEGRNRQVRKMCSAIGHEVVSLSRLSVGELTLGGLKPGEYRKLTPKEIDYLKNVGE